MPLDHRAVLVKLAEESIFDGDRESGQPTKVAPNALFTLF